MVVVEGVRGLGGGVGAEGDERLSSPHSFYLIITGEKKMEERLMNPPVKKSHEVNKKKPHHKNSTFFKCSLEPGFKKVMKECLADGKHQLSTRAGHGTFFNA